MGQGGIAGCAVKRAGTRTRAHSRELHRSVSQLVLTTLIGSAAMAATTTPALANCPALPGGVCFDVSGGSGSDGHHGNDYLGSDGQWGGWPSGPYTLPSTVNATGASAATIQSNGGDGGWGDRSRPSYGWGGNGGRGGGLTINGTGTSVTNPAGYGIDIWAHGGSGGPSAINAGENDHDGRDRGSGGNGGVVVVNLNGITTATQGSSVRINVDGGTGANGAIRPVKHNPRGGPGGNGGQINATISGKLTTTGSGGDGAITLSANGGAAGNSAGDGGGDWPRTGGDGGLGGRITLNFSGTIHSQRYGIYAESRGGAGGDAEQDSNGNDYQTPGGYGSAGGDITLKLGQGLITVTSDNVDAVFATSTGGRGGDGGSSHPGNPHTGKAGGNGGSSGSIAIDNAIGIETHGANSIGINAIVAGGIGGAGGSDSGIIYSKGGAGGRGGGEADLSIVNNGAISTFGIGSHGIVTQSLGGGGASAGNASGGFVSIGGKGGNAGSGGAISLTNYASVQTNGDGANGLMGLSIGGGGGIGGGSLATPGIPYGVGVSLGGSGGAAGDGGVVEINNIGGLTTLAKDAAGIVAHSIGGGGGNANQARLIGVSFVNVAIGGQGGAAGNGGTVGVYNLGGRAPFIHTKGAGGTGIDAKSIGGGGGNAGGTYSFAVNVLPVVNVGVGGDAVHGSGTGNGGAVTVENDGGQIKTEGVKATAILAHSIGGSGGKGGPVDMTTAGALVNVATAVGGHGGGGGSGGAVTVINHPFSLISTLGVDSLAIDAQSIGGGGGAGGAASSDQLTIGVAPPNYPSGLGVNTVVGGAGGSGGAGGGVAVTNNGGIATAGDNATGIFAKSIGGGGGSGGSAIARSVLLATGASLAVSTAVGGSGGSGGDGGVVTVDNVVSASGDRPSIETRGANAAGVAALSIGGGGGSGGNTMSVVSLGALPLTGLPPSVATKITGDFSVAVGGTGGGGGHGGAVTVSNGGSIITHGDASYGVQAQSTGGGGGSGGNAAGLASSIPTLSGAVNVGGKGGSGNIGGAVTVTNSGTIITGGANATAILAQSIGGGGGSGGNAERLTGDTFNSLVGDVNALSKLIVFLKKIDAGTWGPPEFTPTVNASVSVGGNGGSGNHGGTITLANTGTLTTTVAGSAGIEAHSIGGGGGKGGHAYAGLQAAYLTALGDTLAKLVGNAASFKKFSLAFGANIGVGGSGGAGGDGGAVTVTNSGMITTGGHAAAGIVAQSIGGGGGGGGGFGKENGDLDVPSDSTAMLDAIRNILPFKLSATVNVNIGGSGGSAGAGGTVQVTNSAGGHITTTGDASDGILAQSIGGGGGNGAHAAPSLAGATLNLTFQHGGKGGGGGNGGLVTIDNSGQITTGGAASSGILAQSIGGGGGRSAEIFGGGGDVLTGELGGSGQVKMGADGATGAGGDITITSRGGIATSKVLSHGIVAQSISNGGGAHVFVLPQTAQTVLAPQYSLGAVSGSGTSHGGTVKTDIAGSITTKGAASFGVLAQSIGNGGGYAAATAGDGLLDVTSTVTLGASGGAKGDGGQVELTLRSGGSVTTQGRNAIGVVAQSIGGGGGVAALTAAPGLISFANPSNPAAGAGGNVDVTIIGQVETTGDGAIGVLAQSIGGGGGLAGDTASARYGLGLIKDGGTGGSGAGGHVTVNVPGDGLLTRGIVTHGANAPAILAMSLADGGVLTDRGLLARKASGNGAAAGPIDITVDQGATVAANGENSPGIHAISRGGGATGAIGGDITATIRAAATVQGGSGSLGAAIVTDTVGKTTITNSGGYITSLGGVAIVTSGSASVTNANGGSITGDVRLAVDAPQAPASTFLNNGVFSPGRTIFLGGNGVLTNSGFMDLTAPVYGQYDTTRLTGQFVQTAYSSINFGLDFKAGKSDFLSVSGATQFGGGIQFDTQNPLKGRSLTIAHFDQGAQSFTARANDYNGQPITYSLQLSPDRRDLSVSAQGNFANAASAFASDKASIGSYLQSAWDSGNENAAPLFTHFARLKDAAGYAGLLGSMANDASHSRQAAQAHHAYSFFNSLMSCPYFVDGGTRRNEGECVWGRVTGNRIDRDGTRDDSGYRSLLSTYQIGAQTQIAPDWFLGGSLSYMTGDTKSDGAAMTATSHTVSGGLALKRQVGPWLFAAGLRAGYEDTDASRRVILPGFAGLARSSPQFLHLGGRLRAAYEFAFPNWYLRPFADLDISYVHQQAYRESGAGLFDLAALSASRTSVMATPGIEIGGRIDLGDQIILRPYAIAGVSFLANGGWTARMHLAEFSGSGLAPFRMTTGAPKTYGNLSTGLELQTKSGFELRAEYSLRAATRYTDHTASVRAALRF